MTEAFLSEIIRIIFVLHKKYSESRHLFRPVTLHQNQGEMLFVFNTPPLNQIDLKIFIFKDVLKVLNIFFRFQYLLRSEFL